MQAALDMFHDHKAIFKKLALHTNFNTPKLHSFQHWIPSIRYFGSVRGFSTEETEKAHIRFAKDPYRHTNKREEVRQMVLITERREKLQLLGLNIKHWAWEKSCRSAVALGSPPPTNPFWNPIKLIRKLRTNQLQLSICPHYPHLPIDSIVTGNTFRAFHLVEAIHDFAYRRELIEGGRFPRPFFSIGRAVSNTPILSLDCWERISFHNPSVTGVNAATGPEYDVAECRPWKKLQDSPKLLPGRQDTVLIIVEDPDTHAGMSGKQSHANSFAICANCKVKRIKLED